MKKTPTNTSPYNQQFHLLSHPWFEVCMKVTNTRKKMKGDRLSQRLAFYGFRKIFDSINQHGIQKGIDRMGIDGFIEHCAPLGAPTAAVRERGGAVTMIVGTPADLFNNLAQQFRVTLGIIY